MCKFNSAAAAAAAAADSKGIKQASNGGEHRRRRTGAAHLEQREQKRQKRGSCSLAPSPSYLPSSDGRTDRGHVRSTTTTISVVGKMLQLPPRPSVPLSPSLSRSLAELVDANRLRSSVTLERASRDSAMIAGAARRRLSVSQAHRVVAGEIRGATLSVVAYLVGKVQGSLALLPPE